MPHTHCPAPRPFQHTAARRQLGGGKKPPTPTPAFQHTAARRQLACTRTQSALGLLFQHTAARRQLAHHAGAGSLVRRSFNTQPPEGSWQQQPGQSIRPGVSTHSRPKAAGNGMKVSAQREVVSTHSRPKAAGVEPIYNSNLCIVSTHSRPKAAGDSGVQSITGDEFQHTAARRRLATQPDVVVEIEAVSTHSRPKAAGVRGCRHLMPLQVSTHSRPKAAGK